MRRLIVRQIPAALAVMTLAAGAALLGLPSAEAQTSTVTLTEVAGPAQVSYAENGATRVAAYAASAAADHENVAWSLTGNDAADFTIESGVLRFASPPDFEAPADADANNVYSITVNASDGAVPPTVKTRAVTVAVTQVDEAGRITLSPSAPELGTTLTATLSDPEGIKAGTTTTWKWERSLEGGGWNVIGGATGPGYAPVADDVGHFLRVTASYEDNIAAGKSAQATAPNVVLADPPSTPQADPPPDPSDDAPPDFPDKPTLTHPNLGSALDALAADAADVGPGAPARPERWVAVTVYLSGSVSDVVQFLQDNDVEPRHTGEDYIEAYVPASLLGKLAGQPGVTRIRQIIPPQPEQAPPPTPPASIGGHGPFVHGSKAWNAAGYKGEDVRVGIIDGGFEDFSTYQGGDLPMTVQAWCSGPLNMMRQPTHTNDLADCETGNKHGTSVAESLMDIAPEATLYIARITSQGDFRAAVDWMAANDVSVVNMSQSFALDGPGDGTSPYSGSPLRTIDRAVSEGMLMVVSAGNYGEQTWFSRSPAVDADGRFIFHGDDTTNGMYLAKGKRVLVQLRWEDDWDGAETDLDLYLLNHATNKYVATSLDYQTGGAGQIPSEILNFEVPSAGTYSMVARHVSGDMPDWVQLQAAGDVSQIELYTPMGSMRSPGEGKNPGMLAVGAAHYFNVRSIADFSSRGPTPDGRVKPDVVGADCGHVQTISRGRIGNSFCWFDGTSQASPHVAGMAVLVRDRYPAYTAQQTAQYLKANAEQWEDTDPNNTWGHGFAQLPPDGGCAAYHAELEADCKTLLAARDTLAGSGSLNWSAATTIGLWDGVTIGGTPQRVTRLHLDDTGLAGTIPAKLGSLPGLTYLSLTNNKLTGAIPAELGGLSNLTHLYLDNNRLTGAIPAGLSGLTKLVHLYLNDNRLTGPLPQSLISLTKVRILEIQSNPGLCAPADDTFRSWFYRYGGRGSICGATDHADDRAALVALYDATDGDNWTNNANWKSADRPMREWYGVTTSVRGRVTGLHLSDNNLTGSIPAELGSLGLLLYLNLSGNNLTGSIPAELGNAGTAPGAMNNPPSKLLWYLDLSDNELTGGIPGELGDLTALQYLYLYQNNLTGSIPGELSSLSDLTRLWLYDNNLSGSIPSQLAALTFRTGNLNLPGNDFTGTVTVALDKTTVTENGGDQTINVTATLDAGTAWAHRAAYYIESSRLIVAVTGSGADGAVDFDPVTTFALPIRFDATNASASGSFTLTPTDDDEDETTETVTVTVTGIGARRVADVTLTAVANPTITITDDDVPEAALVLSPAAISENGGVSTVTATLSSPATADVAITVAAVGVSALSGDFSLSANKTLTIAEGATASTGDVTITAVENAVLTPNKTVTVSGSVTGTAAKAPADVTLTILEDGASCAGTTAVPTPASSASDAVKAAAAASAGDCQTLLAARDILRGMGTLNWATTLAMSGWTGVTVDGASGRVTGVSIASQNLDGGIPPQLGDLSGLETLNLSNNDLTGGIPSELGGLSSLETLDLSFNKLTGGIPPELGSLSSLEKLDLSENDLTGSIPSQLGDLSNLQKLDLSGNALTGGIPSELGDLTALATLNLLDNKLTGGIPSELGGLTSLEKLELGINGLTGSIPTQLGSLAALTTLDLRNNKLDESIPSQLGSLAALTTLNLSNNQLAGRIPSQLGGLTALTTLDLRNNKLKGVIPPQLGSLTALTTLDLRNNNLSGDIPAAMAALTNLTDLHMDGNDFTGTATLTLDTTTIAEDAGETTVTVSVTLDPGTVWFTRYHHNAHQRFSAHSRVILALRLSGPPTAAGVSSKDVQAPWVQWNGIVNNTFKLIPTDNAIAGPDQTVTVRLGRGWGRAYLTAQPDSLVDVLTLRAAGTAPTITITDDDAGAGVTGDIGVSYAENGTAAVETYTADFGSPAPATVTWSLTGEDSADFTITGGALAFVASPDFEAPHDENTDNVYEVTVTASASGTPASVRSSAVAVTVTQVDEPGTLTLTAPAPKVGEGVTATVTDPETVSTTPTVAWAWERSPDGSSWSAITGAATGRYAPGGDDVGRLLRATATYADGLGAGKTANAQTTTAVPNNQPAFYDGDSVTRTVTENAAAGTAVGGAVAATDPDGHPLIYSLSGTGADNFAVDDNGQITVAEGAIIDYETATSYTITASVRDNRADDGAVDTVIDDTIEVTINVTDVSDAAMQTEALNTDDGTVEFTLTGDTTGDDDTVVTLTVTTTGAANAPRGTSVTLKKTTANRLAGAERKVTVKTVATSTLTTGQTTPPTGFKIGDAVVHISGVELAEGETARVCLPAPGSETTLYRWDTATSAWVALADPEVVAATGTTPRLVCGTTNAFSTFAAMAQAEVTTKTTAWSATLTVDQSDSYYGCDNTDPNQANCSANLTEDDFTYGGVTYTFEAFYWESDLSQLIVSFTTGNHGTIKAALSALKLDLGGTLLSLAAANNNEDNIYWTSVSNPGWTNNQEVSVSLFEPAPKATLVLTPSTINESGSGNSATVTATLDKAATIETTVTVSAAPVTPAVDADIELSDNTTLTFASGATTSTGVVTITAVDNSVAAADKTVTVSGVIATGSGIKPDDVTLTITDDEPKATLILTPASINESGAGNSATVTATLDKAASAETTITVSAAPVEPAVAGDIMQTGTTLTFASGATTSTGDVTITAANNDVTAADKTFTVSGVIATGVALAPDDVTLTIIDDEKLTASVTGSVPAVGGRPTAQVIVAFSEPVESFTASTPSVSVAGATVTAVAAVTGDPANRYEFTLTPVLGGGPISFSLVAGQACASGGVCTAGGATLATTLTREVQYRSPPVTVAADWSLIPRDANGDPLFGPGESFRLIFVSKDTRDKDENWIGHYNEWIQTQAHGNAVLRPISGGFRVLGSASDAHARDNTATTSTATDRGVPIYWVGGGKVADDSPDFYSGGWDTRSPKDQNGDAKTGLTRFGVATGSNTNGTRAGGFRGSGRVRTGDPRTGSPIDRGAAFGDTSSVNGATPLYGLSPVITIGPKVTLVVTPDSVSEDAGVATVTATLETAVAAPTVVTVSAAAVSPAVSGDFTLSDNTKLTIAANATTSTGTVTITAVDNDVDNVNKTVTVSGAVDNAAVFAPADVTLTLEEDGPDCANTTATPDGTAATLVADCKVLLAAKKTLVGTATLNWSTGTAITGWLGVGVSGSRIGVVNVQNQSLNGTIPPQFARLTDVHEFELSNNDLTGTIPKQLANMEHLEHLHLENNKLSGPIPAELGSLTSLKSLRLDDNNLTGPIPGELGSLEKLDELHMGGNNLSGPIPGELGKLSNLTQLHLHNNDLTGAIPVELGSLLNLEHLWLHLNDLSGAIPKELGSLSSLTTLSLNNNDLTGAIPKELGRLSNLTFLDLNGNKLSGAIPGELGSLSRLDKLRLDDNDLTGAIPAALAGLRSVTSLKLAGNNFTGEATLTVSPVLVLEDAGDTEITVTANLDAGTAWANTFNAVEDDGGTPENEEVAAVTTITVSVAGSGVSGVVGFTEVEAFDITIAKYESSGTGKFTLSPDADDDVTPDETITFSASGTGAKGVADATLSIADRTVNLVDDDRPRVTLAITPVVVTEMGGSAVVTATLDTAVNVETVVTVSATPVADVTLTGTTLTIAANETTATGAVTVTAVNNEVFAANKAVTIAGAVSHAGVAAPLSLTLTIAEDDYDCTGTTAVGSNPSTGLLADCKALLASRDVLRGTGTSNLNWSTDIAMGGGGHGRWNGVTVGDGRVKGLWPPHGLNGTIPPQLGSLSSLTSLDLSFNELTGEIPKELGGLTSLTFLELYDNNLTGAIPGELGSLSNLTDLQLRNNQLTGAIPAALANLTELKTLDVKGNKLTGTVTLSLSPTVVNESDGNTEITVTAELDAATAWANGFANNGSTVTVSVDGSGASGVVGFEAVANFDIPIDKDASSATGTFTLKPTTNSAVTPDETITVSVASGTGARGAADAALSGANEPTLSLLDAERPRVTLLLTPAYVTEAGGVATVTATLNTAVNVDTIVNVSATPVSPAVAADIMQTGSALTIAAGQTTSTGVVTITAVDNSVLADNKTFTVSDTVGQTAVAAPLSVTLTIVEDDYDCTGTTAVGANPSAGLLADCKALLASRDVLYGTANLNWSTGTAIGSWNGVTVAGRRVTGLGGLPLRSINGSVPPQLGSLTSLNELRLDGSDLTGPIPKELGSLSNLVRLALDRNDLSGAIPKELGSLSNLVTLSLFGNDLSGAIPKELGSLSNLTTLWLNDNDLSGPIPADLAKLTNLTRLIITGNALTGGVTLSLSQTEVAEDADDTDITVTAQLDTGTAWANKLATSGSVVTVSVDGSGSTTPVVGFTAVDDFDITIAQNASSATGTFTLDPHFDNEDTADETVTVSVVSGTGARGAANATLSGANEPTITITDDDLPPITGDTAVSYAENGAATVATYAYTDPEGDALTWSLGGADADKFNISDGALSFASPPDFETPADDGGDNIYNVTVQVSDGKDADGNAETTPSVDTTLAVVVTVTDVSAAATQTEAVVGGAVQFTLTGDATGDVMLTVGTTGGSKGTTITLKKTTANRLAGAGTKVTVKTVAKSDLTTGQTTPPIGFKIGDAVVDIGGIELGSSETAKVCLPAPGSETTLYRWDTATSAWVELTDPEVVAATSTTPRLVCGTTNSFSTFAAMAPGVTTKTTVWSATLTVDEISTYFGCDNDDDSQANCSANLTEDEFTYGGVDYTFQTFYWDTGEDEFTVVFVIGASHAAIKTALSALTLNLGSTELSLASGNAEDFNAIFWSGVTGLGWTDDQEVSVSLTEPAPKPTFVLTPDSISENGGISTVTATLDKAATVETTVTVSAAPTGDFTLSDNTTLTFASGVTTSTGVVTITAADNSVAAADKTVTVSGVITTGHGIKPDDATLTIVDDDKPKATLVLTPDSINESGSDNSATVTATLDKAASAETTITVSAAPAGDITLSDNTTLTFASGATASTGTVTITAVDNDVVAADKTVTVSGVVATGVAAEPDDVTLTILDDDKPRVSISLTPAYVTEMGGVSTVTATLD